ncbi:MAG TPA: sodium-dependent transporter [Acidobacteriota bacterium]|nr:sodium-dependent transporter [Acidobacteriota bacterium]HQF86784.1 sodium-dependent transporter [Acidobacteriota bacterium]HQG91418.1 sodium-dependent transporter [Acidobacteriota bacterium]
MAQGLTTAGWVFLTLGWGAIIALVVYCFSRVLFGGKRGFAAGDEPGRDRWASRVGLILAMAGNAVGLGNFLRFPVQAAGNGGGAFMIPYFLALLLLGIPMMWVEWTIGRHGGVRGHGTTPGMFAAMWKHPAAKYLGFLGIMTPFTILVYYVFVESWCMAFSWFSLTGRYAGKTDRAAMGEFLRGFQGVEASADFPSILTALGFLALTLIINYFCLYRGISKGIEMLAKIGMPLLFVFGIALAVRVLTLGAPDPAQPDWSIATGLAYIWNPDLSRLGQASVWLAAAGQIFFTLSLGQGTINMYASYLREQDDVTLNGLSTASTNECAEVVLGGTIAIPVAVAFFGLAETQVIAGEGAYNLGFQTMPVIFQQIPMGELFGGMWFGLLFIAGITTSVALAQPAVAFLEDEFGWRRPRAVNTVMGIAVTSTLLVVAFFRHGFLDELDFWAGTFFLVVLTAIEIVLFSWVFGIERSWADMHQGADLRVPRIFKFILKYVTPLYILVLLVTWTWQEAVGQLLMDGKPAADKPYLWGARVLMAAFAGITFWMIHKAWRRKST